MPITFTDDAGDPINLTGSTVCLMAKNNLADEDVDALVDISQTTHVNAIMGMTTLPIDLSSLGESFFVSGGVLKASLWVEDSNDNHIPYGVLDFEIQPSAKYKP
jgi:hypothetical protein